MRPKTRAFRWKSLRCNLLISLPDGKSKRLTPPPDCDSVAAATIPSAIHVSPHVDGFSEVVPMSLARPGVSLGDRANGHIRCLTRQRGSDRATGGYRLASSSG